MYHLYLYLDTLDLSTSQQWQPLTRSTRLSRLAMSETLGLKIISRRITKRTFLILSEAITI